MPAPDPLVVTALLDDATQEWLDGLRRRHFPPARNHLAAHLTLFHALPGEQLAAVTTDLEELTAPPYDVRVSGVRFLGRGVAYDLDAPALVATHGALQRRWSGSLTRQDQQGLRPHVTVQNKVDPVVARSLHDDLSSAFVPRCAQVVGLALWHYRGGPWEPAGRFRRDPNA